MTSVDQQIQSLAQSVGKLKDCPCCGSEAKLLTHKDVACGFYAIVCTGCPLTMNDDNLADLGGVHFSEVLRMLITAWNTRQQFAKESGK